MSNNKRKGWKVEESEIITSNVDPKRFRERFMGLVSEVFDAAEAVGAAREKMEAALQKLDAIGGRSFSAAILELATEPRRVCSQCTNDFIAAETSTDKCAPCMVAERENKLTKGEEDGSQR